MKFIKSFCKAGVWIFDRLHVLLIALLVIVTYARIRDHIALDLSDLISAFVVGCYISMYLIKLDAWIDRRHAALKKSQVSSTLI